LDDSVISRGRSPINVLHRCAAATVAALVLLVTMVPGCAAACCITRQTTTATLMAPMPCCANMPSMQSPDWRQNATLTASSKLPSLLTAGAVAIIPIASTAERSRTFAVAEGPQALSAPAVPAFLRNEQFRI
jgi:hypothetical protein